MGDIRIQKARKTHVPAIMKLLEFANMQHIPSPEMPGLDYRYYFVALDGDQLVGASGYAILSATKSKTQLMVVHPAYRRRGIGERLQVARLNAMVRKGIKTVITNADLSETIEWYKTHFGYREVGKLKKIHEFGDPRIDSWTTLELDLQDWIRRKHRVGRG